MVERCSYSYRATIHSDKLHHPSFSSTLLDAIYRSFDEGEDDMVIYRQSMKQTDEDMANFRRACMIEKWMEKKVTEKVKKPRKNSSWSSSDSSGAGGFFSSSEAESFPVRRPKPIRTGFEKDNSIHAANRRELDQNQKNEGGFSKTKLRALKIYSDLKKVKQPISPGGKLAGFLHALFSGGNMKKHKISGDDSPPLKSTNASTCSSASSFSRSCLSKTPLSRGKPSAVKRSVRFSPVSVIVNDHKSAHEEIKNHHQSSNYEAAKNYNSNVNIIRNVINEELMAHVMEKNRRVEEVARDLLRNYQRKNQYDQQQHSFDHHHLRKSHVETQVFDREFDDEDEDDDAASYASSDLFELDNLSAIGMERYREELPVYETTHLDSTVANGLIF